MSDLKTKPQQQKCPVVLALYPHARGLAHAVMDSPTNIVESGIKSIIPLCTRTCLTIAETYLDYYQPDVVILEDTHHKKSYKRERMTKLIAEIQRVSATKNLRVARYTRQDIVAAFETFNAFTKHEINGVIANCFPEYADKQPRKRGLGDPEPYRAGEFDAISLAYTHLVAIL